MVHEARDLPRKSRVGLGWRIGRQMLGESGYRIRQKPGPQLHRTVRITQINALGQGYA